jgi:bifunctional non-homologous end joining protein LigD
MAEQPVPGGIVPMLARPGEMPANDGDYGFEMKWDGIRAILYLDRGRGRLASRNLLDITRQYPEAQLLAEEWGASRLVLDGEIVALDGDGGPSFGRLQNRMGVASEQAVKQLMETTPVTYMIFDLLYRDGASLMGEPYSRRRDLLQELDLSGKAWQTPAHVAGNGLTVQAISRRLGLEGVMAKRLDSPYQPGKRTGAWLKIKNQMRQELVIGGWLPGGGARSGRIGALMAGYYDGMPGGQEQRLVYAGKVGTGFSDRMLDDLAAVLQPLRRASSPFCPDPGLRGAVFVEPLLVCEVEFTQWTVHGTLRHPSFKGLREDKDPREVVRET